jgi:hypothetical protein
MRKQHRQQEAKGRRRRSTSDRTVAVAIDRALTLLNNEEERDEKYVLREFHSILPSETSSYVIGIRAGAELLRVATRRGRRSVVLYMLCRMSNIVNVADEKDGSTALHHAARSDDIKIAIALMEHGAKLEARDRRGRKPIHYARSRRMIRFLKFEAKDPSPPQRDDELKARVNPIEYLALVDWSVQERRKQRRRKKKNLKSHEKPLKDFLVTDHSPRVNIRNIRKFCDEDIEKVCFPDNLAHFLHEVTRISKRRRDLSSSICEILYELYRKCGECHLDLERFVSDTQFFHGRWHATSDDRIYVIGDNDIRFETPVQHHDLDFSIVSSSEDEDDDYDDIIGGVIPSSDDEKDFKSSDDEMFKPSDEEEEEEESRSKPPEPPHRDNIQWIYGRSSPDSKIWQKWAHITTFCYEENQVTTVLLHFLRHDEEDEDEEEVRGQLIVNRDNGQISIQWDDGDIWNRIGSSPSLGLNREFKLWPVWSRLEQFLRRDDNVENISRFTFGNNTRSYPLIWCIVPIERGIVGPSFDDDFERFQNGIVRRSAIVAVSRFPYVCVFEAISFFLSISPIHTHTHTHTTGTLHRNTLNSS